MSGAGVCRVRLGVLLRARPLLGKLFSFGAFRLLLRVASLLGGGVLTALIGWLAGWLGHSADRRSRSDHTPATKNYNIANKAHNPQPTATADSSQAAGG